VIAQRDLVQRLADRGLSAWSVVERVQDLAIVDERRSLQRRDHRTRLAVTLHHDVPRGRGSATLEVDSFDGSADELIDHASQLALAAIGPAWSSTPPAAPAQVSVVDRDLLDAELEAVALGALAALHRPSRATLTAAIQVLRENVTIIASSGFHTTWLATQLHADAVLSVGAPGAIPASPSPGPTRTTPTSSTPAGRSLAISCDARRLGDLQLDAAVAAATTDLLQLAAARPPVPGPCALWLGSEALLHGAPHGLWTIFAHQADSAIERRGLTRYHRRAEIAPGAAQLAEPLSVLSDGALDFATHSAPVTDDAIAIRRFPLIQRGIAVGLGLSPQEAALRRAEPNGGVRNLVVAPGSWSPSPTATATATAAAAAAAGAAAGRTLEIRRLHALAIDLTTGEASLDVALGFEHLPDRADPIAFTGGTLHLDLITALAHARRSSQLIRRGAYHGPAAILIEDAHLLA
jgi:predicted Zn-dependent protease